MSGKLAGLVALCAWMMPAVASAQAANIDVQNFHPALGPYSIFSVEGAGTLDHLKPAGMLMFNYASEPLVAVSDAGVRRPVVDEQLALHVLLGVGVTRYMQVDLHLPLYVVNDGLVNGEDFGGFTAGDLALRVKGGLLSQQRGDALGLGLSLELRAPTGDDEAYTGTGGVVALPKLIIDKKIGRVLLAANVGAALRETKTVRNLDIGSEMTYGVGAEVALLKGLVAVGVEGFGRTQLASMFSNKDETSLEGLLAVKLNTPAGVSIISGAGGGILGGYGSPEFRGLIGISYAPIKRDLPDLDSTVPEDLDGDGITGAADKCPKAPEDFDKFQDEDGCPDPDNDGDGIPDKEDKCPDKAGKPEQKGCPVEAVDKKVPPNMTAVRAAPQRKFVTLEARSIRINSKIFFETDEAKIKPESLPILDEVAAVLKDNPGILRVEVQGHTDGSGDPDYNKVLSQERAEAVRDYLIKQGKVDAGRLTATGFGSTKPLVKEATDEDRAKNRRVEFMILETQKGWAPRAAAPGEVKLVKPKPAAAPTTPAPDAAPKANP